LAKLKGIKCTDVRPEKKDTTATEEAIFVLNSEYLKLFSDKWPQFNDLHSKCISDFKTPGKKCIFFLDRMSYSHQVITAQNYGLQINNYITMIPLVLKH
jgi:hypothetical protein